MAFLQFPGGAIPWRGIPAQDVAAEDVTLVDVAKQTYDLQTIDSEIDARKKRLAKIDAELQKDKALMSARATLEAALAAERSLEAEQKSLEWDVEGARTRIAGLESRMYGAQAGGPRELQSITVEVEHLKRRQGDLEERALGAMQKVEEARKAAALQQAATSEVEQQLRVTQGHLLDEKARIGAELSEWAAKRQQAVGAVEAPTLKMYEQLRAGKGGIAVARVDRGVCGGCRITLPMTLVQRARGSKQFTYCSSCSRILYVP